MSKGRKLSYRIHNPNSLEDTAAYILKILVAVNKGKVDKAIRQAVKGSL